MAGNTKATSKISSFFSSARVKWRLIWMGPCLAQVIEQRILLDVLTPLSDCRQEIVEKIMERRISGVSYMCWIDFHNGILGLWVFMCPTNNTLFLSLFCVSLSGYHAEGYHAPPLPPRAITPVYTSRLSHQSYHAPPHKYIGLSHPLLVIRIL